MASVPRKLIIEDDCIFHVTWQCHNKDWLLSSLWAKRLYYNLLLKYKQRYKIDIYSYCFMDNHPHLSGRLKSLKLFSDFFRTVNSAFARIYNREMRRTGQVVMDRFKSPRIQSDADLLRVMTYIDLNPKRAGKVAHPRENDFSSFAYYAYGKKDALITPAPSYLELDTTPKRRQEAYRAIVREILEHDWIEKQEYSVAPCIGNPDWVMEVMQKIKESMREIRIRWRVQFKERFREAL